MIDFSLTRNLLLLSSFLTLLFIPIDLVSSAVQSTHMYPATSRDAASLLTKVENLSYYESRIEGSHFFGLDRANTNLPVLRSSVSELLKDYRLTGVMISGSPEAIVENARLRKSLFVQVGDKLGELVVTDIREGLLVVEYFGEKKELRIQ